MATNRKINAASSTNPDRTIQAGVWVWGIITVILALGFLAFVLVAGFYITVDGNNYKIDPTWALGGLYVSVKENGSLVAGILGFSGLAWTHFFKQNNPES